MSLLSMFSPFIVDFMNEQEEISAKNKEKVEECIQKWRNAANLPRKQKKKARKEAEFDYSFWKGIDNWHKEFIGF